MWVTNSSSYTTSWLYMYLSFESTSLIPFIARVNSTSAFSIQSVCCDHPVQIVPPYSLVKNAYIVLAPIFFSYIFSQLPLQEKKLQQYGIYSCSPSLSWIPPSQQPFLPRHHTLRSIPFISLVHEFFVGSIIIINKPTLSIVHCLICQLKSDWKLQYMHG